MSLFTQSGVSLSHIQKLSSQTIEQTFDKALELLESPGWKQGKTFTQDSGHKVMTFKLRRTASTSDHTSNGPSSASSSSSHDKQKLPWHMRSSLHPVDRDLEYDEFRNGLLLKHTINEKEYIPDLHACSLIKTFRDDVPRAEGWLIQYHTPFGTSNREFASLVMTKDLSEAISSSSASPSPETDTSTLRSFAVVQVPILDVPVSKSFVRGKYTSVEFVQEVVDGSGQKSVRWRMATCSNAGGSIPQAATDLALPSQIAHDVPNFIKWAKKKKREG